MHKKSLIYSLVFKQMIISIVPIVNLATAYAKIDRVGKLETGSQDVPLVQIFKLLLWNVSK